MSSRRIEVLSGEAADASELLGVLALDVLRTDKQDKLLKGQAE